ncbi:MAG: NIPSNAP family protein [Rhizobiaceae bacterium]|nr:NIPSNAP family protein [Rhizobiaceae bacterium]
MGTFELRIYEVVPGKMQALQAVFRELAVPLMLEHGINPHGFWETPDDKTLYYVVEHEDMETMASNWSGFYADDRWKTGLAARNRGIRFVADVRSVPMLAVPDLPSFGAGAGTSAPV